MRNRRQRLWLALARRGNEDAFRRLYRELYRPVASYVAGRVPVAEDAEDVTAHIFARFVQKLDAFDGRRGSVMTWVMAMARNAVIDHHRTRRPASCNADELAEVLAGDRRDPLRTLVRTEDLERIAGSLARRPAEIREMFSLRFEQDLRIHEIASLMGISHNAAKQRFARTLREIRRELTNEPGVKGGGRTCAMAD